MRFTSILTEAVRDVVSGTSRALTFGAALALALSLLLVADVLTTDALVNDAARFRSSGAATLTIVSPDGISGSACEALNALPQVAGAGAIRPAAHQVTFAVLSRSPLDAFDATSGMRRVLGVHRLADRGIIVSAEVSKSLGSVRSATTNLGDVGVAGEYDYPADGRRPGFGWAALLPSPADQNYDECWVTVWPFSADVRPLLMTTLSASAKPDAKVEIAQLNSGLGSSFDGFSRYNGRITASDPLFAGAVAFLLAFVAVWLRRLELAARLHDGASRRAVQVLVIIEALMWLLPAAGVSAGIAAGFDLRIAAPDSGSVLVTGLATCAVAILGGASGTAVGAAIIRERQLFRYFKDR